MFKMPNPACPSIFITYQNWSQLTNLHEGWDHVMSIIGVRSNFIEIVHSKMEPSHAGISYLCTFANVNHLHSSNITSKHVFKQEMSGGFYVRQVRTGHLILALYKLLIFFFVFFFVTFLIDWPLSPAGSWVSWYQSCFQIHAD